jgi:hypothetical protein
VRLAEQRCPDPAVDAVRRDDNIEFRHRTRVGHLLTEQHGVRLQGAGEYPQQRRSGQQVDRIATAPGHLCHVDGGDHAAVGS